jgi:hypothetical protein
MRTTVLVFCLVALAVPSQAAQRTKPASVPAVRTSRFNVA